MLNKHDLCRELSLSLNEVAFLHSKRILPEPIRIGGECHWREQDIRKFKAYLRKRSKCRERGIDPDGERGPSVPVYSTAGSARFDPRLVVAAEKERQRQQRSKTLARGSKPIGKQERVELPEVATKTNKVEG